MTLQEMRQWAFIEPYERANGEKVVLVTCRSCERQTTFPEDADLSTLEPYIRECIACREEGVKH